MASTDLPPPPRCTANPAPIRPADSIRRTTSIDVSWPDGPEAERKMVGRARDVLTPAQGGAPHVLAQGEFRLRMKEDKTITAIAADPDPGGVATLVGERGGGHLRMILAERVPSLIETGAPLYLVLDDISGTALVSAFAWSQWYPDWAAKFRERMGEGEMAKMMEQRVNVCWGLQEGNSGVRPEGPPDNVADADAGELRNPADPEGWHHFHEEEGPGFRRARRIDVTRDEAAGVLRIDSAFQDSAKQRSGGRVAIHEYLLRATVDMTTREILALEPEARILPFSECPGAVHNVSRLLGRRIDEIRDDVLAQLRGPEGCTHLNDALRALAEVPRLASDLREPA
ncbi:hypothetical protein B2G71_09510 [Novosphingobium sp. PC22D]|uniref:DUF2889 domain-containing protein n=1 Tax=Novosphingobium sp. PC22D TaxID=1962403 RepID=UPI000BF0704B|nr:DUF2889 domain-containing protein [Novosphingobium sp. PC22D]PEQ13050.1 hypothetical protein B2G71_09510 [Novosphingobium sp. PC22D]